MRPSFSGFRDPARLQSIGAVASRVAAAVALFIAACAIGLGLYAFNHSGRIYEGVSAGNVDLSGLTPSEARVALANTAQTYLAQPVPMTYHGNAYSFVPSESGVSLDIDGTIARAMDVGRTGSIWHRSRVWTRALVRGVRSDLLFSLDQSAFQSGLAKLAPAVVKPPTNAYVDMSAASGPAVIADKEGVSFDAGATGAALLDRLAAQSNASVAIVAPPVVASITAAQLQASLTPAQAVVSSPLVLSALGRQWTISTADLQRIVSVNAGDGSVNVDQAAMTKAINGIAAEINAPARDAQLFVNKQGELQVVPGSQSVDVDVEGTAKAVVAALAAGRHELDISLARADPAISDQAANDAKAKAEALVGTPIVVTWSDGKASITSAQLLAAITIDTNPAASQPFKIGLSPEVIESFIRAISGKINVDMKNASARLVDGKIKVLSDSVNGRAVDVAKSAQAVIKAATTGASTAVLTVNEVKAKYSSADLQKVKVSDLLGDSSTDYSAATDAKRTNVQIAASLETGWLVAPGDVFSYDQYIGAVDQKQGFVTGLGILSDPTTGGITTGPVVGGGICQVSTTIFQAAFWAGMEVVERNTHPYWIATYGQPPHGMLGLDAMVDVEPTGSLDMKFKNTTDHWIAVIVDATNGTLTAKIMGTATGWNIDVQQPVISNYVEPDTGTIYTDSPEIPTGEQRQVESASRGFDASIRRVITDKSGKVIDDYTLTGTYVPSRDRVLVGTGPAN